MEYISRMLKKDVFSVDYLLTPIEAYALGYCVAHSNLMEMLINGLLAEETQCKGTIFGVKIAINETMQDFFKIIFKFFRGMNYKITSFSFLSDVSTELVKDSTSCFDTLEVNLKNNELKMERCKTLGELIRSSSSLKHFTLSQYCAETPVDIPVDMLVPIVTAIGLNTSLESVFFFPNDGLILLAALTALMRTGRSELYPRVLQLLDVEYDDKDATLFLGKRDTHNPIGQPNITVEYLSPANIHSWHSISM